MEKPKRYIHLDGIVEIDTSTTEKQFINSFKEWIESKNATYGGGIEEVDENGDEIKTVNN